jgi:predicted ATPase
VAEHRRLEAVFPALGYEVFILPKTSISGRADFVLNRLDV